MGWVGMIRIEIDVSNVHCRSGTTPEKTKTKNNQRFAQHARSNAHCPTAQKMKDLRYVFPPTEDALQFIVIGWFIVREI
jgi:hypothetical protein